MQDTQVQSLGGEDPLEKEMATHSSILAWKIPWTEKPGGLRSMRSQRVGHNLMTKQQKGHNSEAARWKTCAGRRLGKDVEPPPLRVPLPASPPSQQPGSSPHPTPQQSGVFWQLHYTGGQSERLTFGE